MPATLKDFPELFHDAQATGVLEEWLELLFTPGERDDLNKRLDLIGALLRGQETQREIAKNHQVSIAKITRGSNGLKSISSELQTFLEKHLQ